MISAQIPFNEDIAQSFANLDLPYVYFQEANLDSDPALEQIGLIDLSEQTLVILDAAENEWIPLVISSFRLPITDYQSEIRDVNGDEQPELLILVTLDSDCTPNDVSDISEHWLSVIERVGSQFESLQKRQICEKEVELSSLDVTENLPSPPFWDDVAWEFSWTNDYFGETNNFYEYLDTLTTDVIYRENSVEETLLSLNNLLDSLPLNDPLSDIIRPRFLLTRGYHYELNGDESAAIDTYLELIGQFPRSRWSWLAWTRLELAENVD
jgi:hypothetical protein